LCCCFSPSLHLQISLNFCLTFCLQAFSVDFSRRGVAAKPPNLRISASGNTQYELTQGINSPWARRFTLDPMGLAALNPPMGLAP
ncbi:hypothetical protein, partial [Allofournierella massiliensis]|uniref:hypothetical protein n=1 Tax=Allofournierella massiliensis TaxID=1650663 RepID=UPI0035669927